MYATGTAKKKICKVVNLLFEGEYSKKLKAVRGIKWVAEETLSELNQNQNRASELCKEIILAKFFNVGKRFPSEVYQRYKQNRIAYLDDIHEKMAIVPQSKFRAFGKAEIEAALSSFSGNKNFPRFASSNVSREYFTVGPKIVALSNGISIGFALYGRMDGAPNIDGDITVFKDQSEIASFTASKLVDVAFWQPSKKNTATTGEEMITSFSEPMWIFASVIEAFSDK